MLKLTLDTNCILALDEKREPDSACIEKLLGLHHARVIDVRLTNSSASERQPNMSYLTNYSEFDTRIRTMGLAHLTRLQPPFTVGVSYVGNAAVVDEDQIRLLGRLREALFPTAAASLTAELDGLTDKVDRKKAEGRWRNRTLDVQALWCHLYYQGDLFVTSDKNFLKKLDSLRRLAPSLNIALPCDAEPWILVHSV